MAIRNLFGDDADVISGKNTREIFRYLNISDKTGQGVFYSNSENLNNLEATGTASPISVATGAGVCWTPFISDTVNTEGAVTTPVVGTTGLRVVVRWTLSTGLHTVTVLRNTDGLSTIPAMTQDDEDAGTPLWEISLATGTITTGGTISLTDDRKFIINPGASMIKLREYSGDGTDAVFTFEGIQQDFSSLLLKVRGRSDDNTVQQTLAEIIFNNDTGSNYNYVRKVEGSAGNSVTDVSTTFLASAGVPTSLAPTDQFSVQRIEILSYANTVGYKNLMSRGYTRYDSGASDQEFVWTGGVWSDTSAITRIDGELSVGNWETGSKAELYGVL